MPFRRQSPQIHHEAGKIAETEQSPSSAHINDENKDIVQCVLPPTRPEPMIHIPKSIYQTPIAELHQGPTHQLYHPWSKSVPLAKSTVKQDEHQKESGVRCQADKDFGRSALPLKQQPTQNNIQMGGGSSVSSSSVRNMQPTSQEDQGRNSTPFALGLFLQPESPFWPIHSTKREENGEQK